MDDTIPCGGCGESNPDRKCVGCLHVFHEKNAMNLAIPYVVNNETEAKWLMLSNGVTDGLILTIITDVINGKYPMTLYEVPPKIKDRIKEQVPLAIAVLKPTDTLTDESFYGQLMASISAGLMHVRLDEDGERVIFSVPPDVREAAQNLLIRREDTASTRGHRHGHQSDV